MSKRPSFAIQGMRKKYISLFMALLLLILLCLTLVVSYIQNEQDEMAVQREYLQDKQVVVDSIEDSLNGVLFRARGYYAFQSPFEREQLTVEIDNFKEALTIFEQMSLTGEEEILVNELRNFMNEFENDILPQALALVDENDYEGLRDFSSNGVNLAINDFLAYTQEFESKTVRENHEMYNEAIKQTTLFTMVLLVFSASAIIFLIFMTWRMLAGIIRPIEDLSAATNSLRHGEEFVFTSKNRKDEIGYLTTSFIDMRQSIQENEEELSAQNEELVAQQEVLHEQQDQLEHHLNELTNINKALDQSSVVAITNDHGVLTFVNGLYCNVLGYTKEELLGKSTRMMRSSGHSNSFYENMWETLRSGALWSGETQNVRKDGSICWLRMTIVPYVDSQGIAYQYIMIGQDVTESKIAQQKLADTLKETEMTKDRIETYNQLNHALSTTFDQQQFLNEVLDYLTNLYEFDKSLIVLKDGTTYSSKGVSPQAIERILQDELLPHTESLGMHVKKRMIHSSEQGLDDDETFVYEMRSVISGVNEETLAFFRATRIGYPYSVEECEEIKGVFKRISLAFERLLMYQEVENARKLNQDIIDNVTEGLQFINPNGSMIQHNSALFTMLELEKDWAVEQNSDQWINQFSARSEKPEQLQAFFEAASEQSFHGVRTIRYTTTSDQPKVVDVYASSVFRRDDFIGTIFVHRDITKDHEVDQMKSELVSTVSHELRTPLASVLGFAELLLTKELKPERQQRYVETIHREAKRLTNLINDFLDLQRMEAGTQQYQMQPVKLNELILGVIEQQNISYKHHVFLVDRAVNIEVKADSERLIQVLTNLISNAIKFSPDGGDVRISLHNEWDRVIVSVKDQGIGIPSTEVTQLFQKFKRIDNSESRKIGGTGLGLAICKEIIDKHEGDIWIESTEGEGSKVSFSVPVISNKSEGLQLGNASTKSVMIIEDDTSLALLLSDSLKSNGFSVVHHYKPERALVDAHNHSFVGIVVDLMLSDEQDGWDLIHKLKASDKTKGIPIIISSALEPVQEKIDKYGVEFYLTKPYSPQQLTRIVLSLAEESTDEKL